MKGIDGSVCGSIVVLDLIGIYEIERDLWFAGGASLNSIPTSSNFNNQN